MNKIRFGLLSAAAAAVLLAGCTSEPMRPAPVMNLDMGGSGSAATAPAATAGTYVVQEKDTLYSIAVRNGCNTEELMQANGITNPRTLRVGQVLKLTTARKSPSAASAQAKPFESVAHSQPAAAAQPAASLQAETTRVEPVKPAAAAAAAAEASDKAVAEKAKAEPAAETAFREPVANGRITKRFLPPTHKGIVISATEGAAVMSAADGQVVYVGELRGYGKVAIIRHGDNLVTVYGNNKTVSVATRASVKAGQKIGTVGPTGLLFEVRESGKPVDPVRFVKVN